MRSTSTSPTSCLPPGMSNGRRLAERALAKGRWYTPPHVDERDRAAGQPPRRRGRRRRPVHRVPLRPAGLDAGAARRLPRRADPARPGRRPVRAGAAGDRRGPRRGRDPAVRGMTATREPRATLEDWLTRAAAIEPRTELFIDGRFVPAASGRTAADIAGRDGSTIAGVAEGDAEDVDRAVAAAVARSTTVAGPIARPRSGSGSCCGSRRGSVRPRTSWRSWSRWTLASRSATRSRSTSQAPRRRSSGTRKRSTRSTARSVPRGRTLCHW